MAVDDNDGLPAAAGVSITEVRRSQRAIALTYDLGHSGPAAEHAHGSPTAAPAADSTANPSPPTPSSSCHPLSPLSTASLAPRPASPASTSASTSASLAALPPADRDIEQDARRLNTRLLIHACRARDANEVLSLLERRATLNPVVTDSLTVDDVPLVAAVRSGDLDLVRLLLRAGAATTVVVDSEDYVRHRRKIASITGTDWDDQPAISPIARRDARPAAAAEHDRPRRPRSDAGLPLPPTGGRPTLPRLTEAEEAGGEGSGGDGAVSGAPRRRTIVTLPTPTRTRAGPEGEAEDDADAGSAAANQDPAPATANPASAPRPPSPAPHGSDFSFGASDGDAMDVSRCEGSGPASVNVCRAGGEKEGPPLPAHTEAGGEGGCASPSPQLTGGKDADEAPLQGLHALDGLEVDDSAVMDVSVAATPSAGAAADAAETDCGAGAPPSPAGGGNPDETYTFSDGSDGDDDEHVNISIDCPANEDAGNAARVHIGLATGVVTGAAAAMSPLARHSRTSARPGDVVCSLATNTRYSVGSASATPSRGPSQRRSGVSAPAAGSPCSDPLLSPSKRKSQTASAAASGCGPELPSPRLPRLSVGQATARRARLRIAILAVDGLVAPKNRPLGAGFSQDHASTQSASPDSDCACVGACRCSGFVWKGHGKRVHLDLSVDQLDASRDYADDVYTGISPQALSVLLKHGASPYVYIRYNNEKVSLCRFYVDNKLWDHVKVLKKYKVDLNRLE
jgi:hypothetical protein